MSRLTWEEAQRMAYSMKDLSAGITDDTVGVKTMLLKSRHASRALCDLLGLPWGTRLVEQAPAPYDLTITLEAAVRAICGDPTKCVIAQQHELSKGYKAAIFSRVAWCAMKLDGEEVIVKYDHRAASKRVMDALDKDHDALYGLTVRLAPLPFSRTTEGRRLSKGKGIKHGVRRETPKRPSAHTRPVGICTRSYETM